MVTVIRWVTDTIRPYPDYGRRLHTDLPQRLVRMHRGRRFPRKTPIGQSVCLMPSPCNEFEPSRHNPFVRPTGASHRLVASLAKKVISCDYSAGYMYACNHILALSALGILPPQTHLYLVTRYALRQLIGTTYMPSCRRYAGPVAVSIIMNEG